MKSSNISFHSSARRTDNEPGQRPVCGCVPAERTQLGCGAGEPEVQRGALKAVDLCAQRIRTPPGGLAVPVIAKCWYASCSARTTPARPLVEGPVPGVHIGAVDQAVSRAAGETGGPRTARQLIGPTDKARLAPASFP
jgi:hypothetical protein